MWSVVLLLATVILLVFLVWEFTAVNSVGGDSLVVGVSSGSGYPCEGGTTFPGDFSFRCGVGRCFCFVPVSLFILADFGVMSSVGSVPLGREPVVVVPCGAGLAPLEVWGAAFAPLFCWRALMADFCWPVLPALV